MKSSDKHDYKNAHSQGQDGQAPKRTDGENRKPKANKYGGTFNSEAKNPGSVLAEWQFTRVRVFSKDRFEYEGTLVNIDDGFSELIRCHSGERLGIRVQPAIDRNSAVSEQNLDNWEQYWLHSAIGH